MPFLNDNEHLIHMDMCVKYEQPKIRLPADDIKKLVDAGITTAMSFGTDWQWIEPEMGKYDWNYYDDRIKLLTDCGMKVIFQAQTFYPYWIPENWLVKAPGNRVERMISPWNSGAWEYAKAYYKMVRDRYNSKDVLVMSSWLADGESLFPNRLCCYDDYALQEYKNQYGDKLPVEGDPDTTTFLVNTYIKVFAELQLIMAENEHNEIWTCMHPALLWHVPSRELTIEFILDSFKAMKPETTINHLYCTWSQWQHYFPWMNRIGARNGNVFGGAEYAQGVINNTILAIQNNVRGLLIGCCHPHTGYSKVEDWMLANIRQAVNIYRAKG